MTVKKALIFAAGFGRRLAPITDQLPKPLVSVGGKPLICYHIEKLVQAGVVDLVINTHWLHQKLVDVLGDGSAFGARIHWSHESEILETGGGMQNALPILGGEPFLVISADVWTDYPFESLITRDLGQSLAHLVLVNNPLHHSTGDFALSEEGVVMPRIPENLSAGQTNPGYNCYTYSGIGLYRPEFISQYKGLELKELRSLAAKPYPLREPLNRAISKELVSAEHYSGRWHDIGTFERLQLLDTELRS